MALAKKPPKKKPPPTKRSVPAVAGLSRRTITIKRKTEKEITDLVGPRKFSAFVQSALDRQLQSERVEQWLAEQEAEHGPLSPEDIEFAENAWNNRGGQ